MRITLRDRIYQIVEDGQPIGRPIDVTVAEIMKEIKEEFEECLEKKSVLESTVCSPSSGIQNTPGRPSTP